MEALEKRLRGRGTEKEEAIVKRLANAQGELDYGTEDNFDVVLVNNNLDKTFEEMVAKFKSWYPDLLGEEKNKEKNESPTQNNGVANDEDIPPPVVDPLSFPKSDEGLKALLTVIDKDCPLEGYSSAELHYQASNVYIAAGKKLDIPLPPVEQEGSKIEWTITVVDEYKERLDIEFGLVCIVDGEEIFARGMGRIISPTANSTDTGDDGEKVSAKGKFTVASAPPPGVTVMMKFDNSYSWIKSKKINYFFLVKAPVDDTMIQRSLRAKSVLPKILDGQKELKTKKEQETSRAEALGRMQTEMKEKMNDLTHQVDANKLDIGAIKKRSDEAEEEAKVKANEVKEALLAVKKEEQSIDECTASIKALEDECARLKEKWAELKIERQAREEHKLEKEKEAEESKEARIKLQEKIQQKKDEEQAKIKQGEEVEIERNLLQVNLDDLEKEKKARLVDQEKYASELKFLQKQMSEVKLRFIEQKKK